jgi:16S rRNA processing protein RimM
VRELLSTGAQTVLVLEYLAEGKAQERMIPFVAAFIDDVDLSARRIRVDWQSDY